MTEFQIVKPIDTKEIGKRCYQLRDHEIANTIVVSKDGVTSMLKYYWNSMHSTLLYAYVCGDKVIAVSYRWYNDGKEQNADLYIDIYKKIYVSELLG